MATLIKGKVLRIESPLMLIKRIDGLEFWTEHRPEMEAYDFVWIAWDYTRGKPAQILTRTEMEDLQLRSTESSPPPLGEDEGPETKNEIDSEDTNYERLEVDIERSEYDDRSFSIPKREVSEEYEVRSFSDPVNEG